MIIRHVKNNSLTREENCYLYMLFLEEGIIKNLLGSNSAVTKYEQKLVKYAKNNKFKLLDIGTVSTANFNEMIKKYEFIIVKDKRDIVVGYLCFERTKINRVDKENNKELFIVKHMYISNSQNHTNIDYKMFWLMENLSDKCIVYSELGYRPCNQYNGFDSIGRGFLNNVKAYIKKKEEINFPLFMDSWERSCLLSMLSVIQNTEDRSCRI